jgi:hypothetical protein
MSVMRRTVKSTLGFWDSFTWSDFWIGGAERAVATTLVVFAPSYLAGFIGGWVALKFAANWKRQPDRGTETALGGLLFLVGNVISFSIAVTAGLPLNPAALDVWAK